MIFALVSVMQNPLDKKKPFAVILTSAEITLTPGFDASDSKAKSKAFPIPLDCHLG